MRNVKKIILWGDGVLAGSAGFGDLLVNHIFLHHPRADVSAFVYGGEHAGLQDALRETPLHVIGKAPDLVLLGFGYADLAAGKSPEDMARMFQSACALVLQKTEARVCLLSLIPTFFPDESEGEKARDLNARLRGLVSQRILFTDLETPVQRFLEEHKRSPGEKRALHLDSARLTTLGRLVLAHHAYQLIPWPDLDGFVSQGKI